MSKLRDNSRLPPHLRRVLRAIIAAACLFLCFWGARSIARAGISRLLSNYGLIISNLEVTDAAVRLSSLDPEAHYARARALVGRNEFAEAIGEFERAAALRPADYVLWMELGSARDQAGDAEGALSALAEAVRLAPYYARTHWQLGNVLLRSGRTDQAFAELRRAAASDPALFLNTVDLAWNVYGGDPRRVEQALQPQTTRARLALAHFFVKHGQTEPAIQIFNATGDISGDQYRSFITELLAVNMFREAHAIWSASRGARGNGSASSGGSGVAVIHDGGFERGVRRGEPVFEWQPGEQTPTMRLFSDTNVHRSGTRSLLLEFNGNSNPSTPILSQVVLVEPNARYQLRFAARTEGIVTGGAPVVVIADAERNGSERLLGQSNPLPATTGAWQDFSVEFSTGSEAKAILVRIQRQLCASEPCPIFGSVWFDDFSLNR